MKKTGWYEFRLFLIRFFIIGMMAYIVEVFFTGFVSLGKAFYSLFTVPGYVLDLQTVAQGHVGLAAFFVYCWAAIPFTFLSNPLKKLIPTNLLIPRLGFVLRGIIYGLIFMAIEFLIGLALLLIWNTRGWDYSHLPLNVMGLITFLYLPAWTLAGMIGEAFHDRLLQIDDILINPKGYSDRGVKKGFITREKHKRQNRKRKKK